MSKYVFHVPCLKYKDGRLVYNFYQECIDIMAKKLVDIGVNGFYVIDAVGCYKMREYNEKLLIVFSDNESVADLFKQTCKKLHGELEQEVYAYERDNEINFFKVDDK